MTSDPVSSLSPIIREKAPLILAEIKKASSILLHCHPSPDPDSVGSALAMKFALEQMGRKAAIIAGDSKIPDAFIHFPGARDIVPQNFFEADLSAFDLFIVQDCSKAEMISKLQPVVFPPHMKVIVIDHHASNAGYGSINLIDSSYPATAQILFDVFKEWGVALNHDIALNLFMGMYTDTGGFKYTGTTDRTFSAAGALAKIAPDFTQCISGMENSRTLPELVFQGAALSSIESFLGGKIALSLVPYSVIAQNHISNEDISGGMISSIMRSMGEFSIVGSLVEHMPGAVKCSFRSKDGNAFDVSKLSVALGGGGHKAAAGASLGMSLEEAKLAVVAKAKELYNL